MKVVRHAPPAVLLKVSTGKMVANGGKEEDEKRTYAVIAAAPHNDRIAVAVKTVINTHRIHRFVMTCSSQRNQRSFQQARGGREGGGEGGSAPWPPE